MNEAGRRRFIRRHTRLASPPLVPELRLHLATEMAPLWRATQKTLDDLELPPPYWAFAWPGGQALARFLLDGASSLRGRRVFTFAAGSGVDAIAAALAGAEHVVANDIDPFALSAIALNAKVNGVEVRLTAPDVLDAPPPDADVVIAGDMYYEGPMAERAQRWLRRCAATGATVLVADPGRSYVPEHGLEPLASYDVPTSVELEDATTKRSVVYRVD
ncbi:MAG: methyltransferase [Alphaproteobacteria bacterium]|nr:methyltransferase [Alphaproteobacteria bacterium]